MRNLKLTIEYDGTNYHGFQDQVDPELPTVQATLERVLSKLTQEPIKVYAAGRTDAGVHAKGQVVNFKTYWATPADRVCRAINSGGLPKDIVVKFAEEVDMEFHSRYSAREKTYKYYVYNNEISNPFWRRYSLFVPQALNIELMREGLSHLIGYHEFTSFKAYGSSVKSDWRTIYEASVNRDGPVIEFTFRGDGFLYNMVRIIVGTIIMVGRGKISPERLAEILLAKDRNLAGKTAPPQGLFLEKVDY